MKRYTIGCLKPHIGHCPVVPHSFEGVPDEIIDFFVFYTFQKYALDKWNLELLLKLILKFILLEFSGTEEEISEPGMHPLIQCFKKIFISLSEKTWWIEKSEQFESSMSSSVTVTEYKFSFSKFCGNINLLIEPSPIDCSSSEGNILKSW